MKQQKVKYRLEALNHKGKYDFLALFSTEDEARQYAEKTKWFCRILECDNDERREIFRHGTKSIDWRLMG